MYPERVVNTVILEKTVGIYACHKVMGVHTCRFNLWILDYGTVSLIVNESGLVAFHKSCTSSKYIIYNKVYNLLDKDTISVVLVLFTSQLSLNQVFKM